ncbi:hypothetical protein ACFY71_29215 [Streptomyces cinerochromogenes]|uniref:hypothetical protein n=1 Tax=Streptomyces cinerochromogenes TaxID=66422 RepID=UPI0036A9930C
MARALYFRRERADRYDSSSHLKHGPSIPAAVHSSRPRATTRRVVDGRNVSGASKRRSATSDSSAAPRRSYAHPVRSALRAPRSKTT